MNVSRVSESNVQSIDPCLGRSTVVLPRPSLTSSVCRSIQKNEQKGYKFKLGPYVFFCMRKQLYIDNVATFVSVQRDSWLRRD